jgi:hypothetical protein
MTWKCFNFFFFFFGVLLFTALAFLSGLWIYLCGCIIYNIFCIHLLYMKGLFDNGHVPFVVITTSSIPPYKNNTTGTTGEAGTAYRITSVHPGFLWGLCWGFVCSVWRLLFIYLSLFCLDQNTGRRQYLYMIYLKW